MELLAESSEYVASAELQLAIFLQGVSSKDEIFGICSRYGISEGFNNVIGVIDGIHIILKSAPFKQPEIYWNHKKKYSIQCQGIVNHCGIFIDYEIGWLDSDFLLGDSAYPLSIFLIKLFNNPENNLETQFYITHSLYHVVVKNAFGKFKNRFSSLKELNGCFAVERDETTKKI
ncbi:hypothetical protein C1646_749251 [Rhizophagus diaphanus]|nr:hypothetical protein C1646_749251 [Rhizophagus diaphanus] [Rhizophagus sp. MUCL 43196]